MTRRAFCVGQAKAGTASLAGLLSANYRAAHEPERAETLDLDYDVAWANQFIVDHLLAVFPEAAFIVLIRDCHTWLQSIAGHLVGRDVPGDVHAHELGSSHERLAAFLRIPVSSLARVGGHLNRGTWSGRIESLADPAYIDEMVHSICDANMARHFPEIGSTRDVSRGLASGRPSRSCMATSGAPTSSSMTRSNGLTESSTLRRLTSATPPRTSPLCFMPDPRSRAKF